LRLFGLIRRPAVIAVLALACVAGVGLGLAIAGGDGGEDEAGDEAAGIEPREGGEGDETAQDSGEPSPPAGGEAASPEADPEPTSDSSEDTILEREAEHAVRGYVDALVEGDGELVCALFVPGALEDFKLPVQRGDCAASLDASIGYRDPRGYPQWERAEVEAIRSVEVSGDEARVTATIVSEFADRDEPSVEDDVIYLSRSDDQWLVAAPSAILYRAVGAPDVPPQVLAPPG
jgi:hypothetical protein